jgi:hypothetical protein
VQAFLAINVRRSALILVTDSSRAAITVLCSEVLAEGVCGDRRDFDGFKCFVSAGGFRRGWLLVRDMRDCDREAVRAFKASVV